MGNLNLIELKKVELDIFKEFIKICHQNNLKYFVLGGTCLGAVRHKGFIPWDDDIDVGMPREDYEKFSKIAQSYLPSNMFFQNHYTDSEYIMCFSKIRNSETTYIEKSVSHLNINHGVYIDIFPLDGMPNKKIEAKIFNILKKIYNIRIGKEISSDNKKGKSIFKSLGVKLIYLIYNNLDKTIRKRDSIYMRYSYYDSKIVANHGGAWGKKEIMPRDYFGKGILGSFEGIKVILPEKYDEYLTKLYGDYMTPPPPKKRVGHHYYTVADMNKSYKEYIK